MRKLAFIAFIATVSLLGSCSSNDDNNPVVALTETEENDILTLREEEKLARDVYLYAFDRYSETTFKNIASSEQKHMDKMLTLINTYGLTDPASSVRGVFNNTTLQTLYNDLTAQVDISLVEALKVGATIEDLDIRDIEDFEARTDKSDILSVYSKLKCGSRNHMRAYYGKLIDNGVTYIAQFISAADLAAIISAPNEQCGR